MLTLAPRGFASLAWLAIALLVPAPLLRAQAPSQPASPIGATPPTATFDDTATTFSQSGQFIVSGPRPRKTAPLSPESGPSRILRNLTPPTLAVSCERVKSEILRALDLTDTWRDQDGRSGKIFVVIDPTLRTNVPITVAASRFEKGWHFRIALPPTLAEDRLVRSLTEAVVLELGNRQGNQRLAEAPLWFVEGLTQTVLAVAPSTIALQPQSRAVTDVKLDETLAGVRRELGRRAPLSFQELTQPDLAELTARDWPHYAACAHLCVHELSRLPEGRTRLVRWLGALQSNWNWQTGFVEAFQPGFRSLLDIEKWWAITLANFTGHNPATAWPASLALRKLDEALQPVGVFAGNGSRATRLDLDDVARTWDFQNQAPLFRQLLRQLHSIRLGAPPEVAPLVAHYIDAVEEYLDARSRVGTANATRGQIAPSPKMIARNLTGRLRELDAQRAQLRQDLAVDTPTPSPVPTPSGT